MPQLGLLFDPDFHFLALPVFGLKFVARTGFESGWRQSRNSANRGSVPFSADLFHSQGSCEMGSVFQMKSANSLLLCKDVPGGTVVVSLQQIGSAHHLSKAFNYAAVKIP